MSFTNSTPNYGLPQYIGTDKPTYLGDMNTAYSTIDTQMKANADAASAATSTANTAAATATAASTNATTALNTANSAASEAASATSAAASATSTANSAATNASAALRASAANTIENLAPAYDPTLTYNVDDLVTYIDENNSGKLYKCIVAIDTPEAFNINKWDDVTVSEVYERKYNVTSFNTEANVTTIADFFDWLGSVIPDIFNDIILERVNPNTGDIDQYRFTSFYNGVHYFHNVGLANDSVSDYFIRLSDTLANSQIRRLSFNYNDGTYTKSTENYGSSAYSSVNSYTFNLKWH